MLHITPGTVAKATLTYYVTQVLTIFIPSPRDEIGIKEYNYNILTLNQDGPITSE